MHSDIPELHQWPPGPDTSFRLDADRSLTIQIASPRFCSKAVRGVGDLESPAASATNKIAKPLSNLKILEILFNDTERHPDQIVHESDHIPVAALRYRIDND